jgi:hypothetical protein
MVHSCMDQDRILNCDLIIPKQRHVFRGRKCVILCDEDDSQSLYFNKIGFEELK